LQRRRPCLEALEDRTVPSAVVVTKTVDDGTAGTLRWAIQQANTTDATEIAFQIGDSSAAQTIVLDPDRPILPSITKPLLIDGFSQGGDGSGTPPIGLRGNRASEETGIFANSADVTIQGLAVFNFGSTGIVLTGDDHVVGCYVGTDLTGTAQGLGNAVGIGISGGDNTVDKCVVSGNTGNGVWIADGDVIGNSVTGNVIGLDKNGTGMLANGGAGVAITAGASATFVGAAGDFWNSPNIISGNSGPGILIRDAQLNVVQNNLIGTDPTGGSALGNSGDGVDLDPGSSENRILNNIIAGNGANGVKLAAGPLEVGGDIVPCSDNTIQGNSIGTAVDGVNAVANQLNGVLIDGATNNLVGGSSNVGQGNIISGNRESGVRLIGGASENEVYGNLIGTDFSGTAKVGNRLAGVELDFGSNGNTIGGTSRFTGNVISGQTSGVNILESSANYVEGNFIGTDVSGTATLSNNYGVTISGNSNCNIIGGKTPGARNIISGNVMAGVQISAGTTNYISGNYIGTDVSGTARLGNGFYGVWVHGGDGSVIGGSEAGDGNVISGNGFAGGGQPNGQGIFLDAGTGARIQGNYVGTSSDGTAALPNRTDGIWVLAGADNTTIGGAGTNDSNIIAGNGYTTSAGTGVGLGIALDANNCLVQGNWIGLSDKIDPGTGMPFVLPNKAGWRSDVGQNNIWTNNDHN
jgi:hypothetical protein